MTTLLDLAEPFGSRTPKPSPSQKGVCGERGSAGSTVVENRDPGRLSLAATEYPDAPETHRAYQDYTFHLYLPWSERGHGGYPPPGAVAVCGEVKGPEVRPVVTADHPRACVRCTVLFDRAERDRIEDRNFEEGRDG